MSARVVREKKYENEAERKKAYRERMKNELGLDKYLEQQRLKKKEQRARAKAKQPDNKNEPPPPPKPSPPPPQQQQKLKQSLITSYFKPTAKPTQPIQPTTPSKRSTVNIKPVLKLQERLNKEVKKAQILEEELNNDKNILNVKPPARPKKQLDNIKPLHVKYDNKKVEKKTVNQYLSKLKTIHKKIFKSELLPGVIDELQKLMDGKEFNQGVINHLMFFKRIKFIINEIKKIYNKDGTISAYLNAVTSILSRIPYFKEEYNIISVENNLYSSKYKNKRDTNDGEDIDINKLISFDPSYINKTIDDIKNISDKALFGCYTLIPVQRLQEFFLMKVMNKKIKFEDLDKKFNYVLFENGKPYLFMMYNHKTKKSYPEKQVPIPPKLSNILLEYIESNNINNNEFLFGKPETDFKKNYSENYFSEKISKLFQKYTGKKISVDILRASYSTWLDSKNISLGERRKIAYMMGHSLDTNLQYSKKVGVERITGNKQIQGQTITQPEPEIKRNTKRSTRKDINYNEN